MANLTADKTFPNGTGREGLITYRRGAPEYNESTAVEFYRGAALLRRTTFADGTNQNDGPGVLTPTIDGTIQGIFAGVCGQRLTSAVNATVATYQKAYPAEYAKLICTGSMRFKAAGYDEHGAAWSPGVSDIGKTMWFQDNQTVGPAPLNWASSSVLYPWAVPAGILIAVHDETGAELEVEITHHVNRPPRSFLWTLAGCVANASGASVYKIAAAAAMKTSGQGWFIRRAWIDVTTSASGGTSTALKILSGAADATPYVGTATASGSFTDGSVISENVGKIIRPTDALAVGFVTVGAVTNAIADVYLDVVPLGQ